MAASRQSSPGKIETQKLRKEEAEAEAKFSEDEESLIIRMYNLVGGRWHLIAGRIPGRTAREIEKYWSSRANTNDEQDAPLVNGA